MKRTMFGDPRPKGRDEITEAMNELGIDPGDARAMIDEPSSDGHGGHGWSAEIDAPVGDEIESFSTLAYETREGLLADIEAVGITDVEDYT